MELINIPNLCDNNMFVSNELNASLLQAGQANMGLIYTKSGQYRHEICLAVVAIAPVDVAHQNVNRRCIRLGANQVPERRPGQVCEKLT